MPSLLERLNDALTPDFHVERELARGGMGVVFLARDTNLKVQVAIKVLLPETATETATERFLREARILAALSHSHIVPVHRAGVADGLNYYVMDYMEGDTLADRLHHGGALSKTETVKLGRDMLDALETVHKAGVVHRDIKPSNIFLLGRRTVLVDFGIAKPQSAQTETLTRDGFPPGTPLYMPPEHWEGREVTPQTDICALGMVLYEALTTRPWVSGTDPRKEDWTGVPWSLRSILARALAYSPHDRWPNAQTFRRRLRRTRLYQYWMRAAALAAGGLVVGGTAVGLIGRNRGVPPDGPVGALTVQVRQFEVAGDSTQSWLGDSVASRLEDALRTISEFRVFPQDTIAETKPAVVLGGRVVVSDSGITAYVQSVGRTSPPVSVEFAAANWEMVADSVITRTIRKLWSESSPLAPWLPVNALPADPEAFDRWLNAERLLTDGLWDDAHEEFHNVVKIDSTCLLCSWRITEIDRWYVRPPDSVHRRLAIEGYDRFPPHYRRLIHARLVLTHRLDSLRIAADDWSDYYYAWFLLGEEQLNRGPLYGRPRADAGPSLERAALLRPSFAVTWWDLAWLRIAQGDSVGAREALDTIPDPQDRFSLARVGLLQVAFAYRFGPTESADALVRAALANEEIGNYPGTIAGPRLMPSFDTPEGAVSMGSVYLTSPRPALRQSGLVAEVFGYFAQGQLDSAWDRAAELRSQYEEATSFPLFLAKLEAVNRMFDPAGSVTDHDGVVQQLERYAAEDVGEWADRRGARWILHLLEQREAAPPAHQWLYSDSAIGDSALDIVIAASRLARAGRPQEAIDLGNTVRDQEVAHLVPDPFFRTVLHLLMAEWYDSTGNLQKAVEELRWHEAVDEAELPTEEPLVQEIDWAFGTLARWKRARLLDSLQDMGGETCSVYGAVARLWGRGDPEYASRAEIARRRLEHLGCIAAR